jgi:hypothetical protein
VYVVDYTIRRASGEYERGRRRLETAPRPGASLILAGLRIRVGQVEDLRGLASKGDFEVHGHELRR